MPKPFWCVGFLLFVSTLSCAQLNPVYFGFRFNPAISVPTQDAVLNKLFAKAFSPSFGLVIEKKVNERLNIMSGMSLLSRAYKSLYYRTAIGGDRLADVWADDIYLSIPVLLKSADEGFFAGIGLSVDFLLSTLAKINQPQQKFELNSINGMQAFQISMIGQVGYSFNVGKFGKICAALEGNEGLMLLSNQFIENAGSGLFTRFNGGLSLSYQFIIFQSKRR